MGTRMRGILSAHAPRKPLLMRKTAGMRRFRVYGSIFPPIFEYPKSPKCKAEITHFTITAEILVWSLANFYRQYADRHMNLKFVRRVSERERAIRPFVIVKNKLMSVFNEFVLLLTMNFVITLSK